MMCRLRGVLARGIEAVNFSLQLRIWLGMSEDAEENARKTARSGVRTSDNGKDTVVDELLERRRALVWQVFVVLRVRG